MSVVASVSVVQGVSRHPFVYLMGEIESLLGTDTVYTSARPKEGDRVRLMHQGETLYLMAYGDQEMMFLSMGDLDTGEVKRMGRGAWFDKYLALHRLFRPQVAVNKQGPSATPLP